MKKILSLAAVALIMAGYAVGTVVEDRTHAYHVAHITGTSYFKVLDAWSRLQASGMSDSDCQAFDDEIHAERVEGNQD